MGEKLRALVGIPAFAGLPAIDVVRVAAAAVELDVGPGEALASEGVLGRQSFVVLEGTAAVRAGGQAVAHLGPGSFVGHLDDQRRPRTATVVAETPMRVMVISPASLEGLSADGTNHTGDHSFTYRGRSARGTGE